jgi:tetratricopeptide (TPR) repeat protein
MMSADAELAALVRRARQATERGEPAAREIWQQVLARDPSHLVALSALAALAFRLGDHAAAAAALDRALASRPDDPVLLRNLAAVRAASGDLEAALAALRAAAAAQPGSCVPLLESGLLLAEAGRFDDALRALRAAWAIEPRLVDPAAADQLAAPLPELARRARAIGREWLERRCAEAFDRVRAAHGAGVDLDRVVAALRAYQGYEPTVHRDPRQRTRTLYLPGLEARAWFERAEFDWAAALEAETEAIRAELLAVAAEGGGTEPYLTQAPEPGADWLALAGKDAWSSFFLYKEARRVPENCARCPRTEAALLAAPTARSHGVPGEAMFSMLKPHTRIPPHHGYTNTKLTVHLPLVIPPGCGIKVGGEARGWTVGELIAFDDSYLHEAWNGSDALRAVLIFEVWHPGLTPPERDAVAGVLDAIADQDRL